MTTIGLATLVIATLLFVSSHDRQDAGRRPSTSEHVETKSVGSIGKNSGGPKNKLHVTRVSPSTSTTFPHLPTSPFVGSVTDYLQGRTGTVTAALFDVNTGQTFDLHPAVVEDEASIVKVDIMATLLSQQPDGSVPTSPNEQQLLTSMVEDSDNDSATALWNEAGGPAVINSFNQRIGMISTVPSECVVCSNFPWPGWGLTKTTPDDQIKLIEQFLPMGSLLSESQRTYGLGLLENIAPSESWGVNGGIPAGVTVALKNGWLPLSGETDWQINSIGWIDGEGRNYILAVMTTGNPTEDYGIATINAMSSSIWSAMGS